jgi:hypothetical protein
VPRTVGADHAGDDELIGVADNYDGDGTGTGDQRHARALATFGVLL